MNINAIGKVKIIVAIIKKANKTEKNYLDNFGIFSYHEYCSIRASPTNLLTFFVNMV